MENNNLEDFREIIIKNNDKSGKMFNEKYIKNNYIDIYNEIIYYCKEIDNLQFKEKVYHYLHQLKEHVYCKNKNCNNKVKFKNSTLGYYNYCSIKCISSDSNIKDRKEKKSFEKYGTKAPAMNNKIKEKIIKTNKKRYGSNSPMSNNKIKKKSKKTLFENYGVENPSRSDIILKKRIKTFKNTIKEKYLKLLENKNIKNIDYENKIMYFHCDDCNQDFNIHLDLFHNRNRTNTLLCTICNPIDKHVSGQEIQLQNFIKNIYDGEILLNNRSILSPYELDIYLPDLKLAFEFNGLYYHCENFVENDYHLRKTELAEKNNIQLIQIYEDDWTYKQNIIKSIILNKLGKSEKIYARLCTIKEVDNKNSIDFLEKNHLQGKINSKIRIGLYYNNNLISLTCFSKNRKNLNQKNIENTYELVRFTSLINTNVIGGFSKMLNYFVKNYNPEKIVTFADRSFSRGNLYLKSNFSFIYKTSPNYFYVINKLRKNRFLFRKDLLIKQGYDPNKTEHQIMLERKIYRIYDSGNLKFIWKQKKGD